MVVKEAEGLAGLWRRRQADDHVQLEDLLWTCFFYAVENNISAIWHHQRVRCLFACLFVCLHGCVPLGLGAYRKWQNVAFNGKAL